MEKKKFWSMPIKELLFYLSTSKKGLSSSEAKKRLEVHGKNEIVKKTKRSALKIFLSQFKNPLILVLIIATLIAFFLGEHTEAIVILLIVVSNGLLGFIQEFKSEKALRKLRKYIVNKTKVFRDEQEIEIDSKDLVPGDIVSLEIGDLIPADIRLLECKNFSTNESALTGESTSVVKDTGLVKLEKVIPQDLKNTALMGTIVASGSGLGVVVATGKNTFFGKTAAYLKIKVPETDFHKNIRKFGNLLLKIILLMTIFIFIVNAALNHGVYNSLLFALALAVGIIPEMLPIIITIALSKGALDLVDDKVVVKRLSSIEDLGNVDVICADKTGTLTENKLSLKKFLDLDEKNNEEVLLYGLLSSDVIVGKTKIKGDPIDSAIWAYAKEKKFDLKKLDEFSEIDKIAFDFERRRKSKIVKKGNTIFLVSKGSPNSIIEVCSYVMINKRKRKIKDFKEHVIGSYTHFSEDGYRVIAVAIRKIIKKKTYSIKDEKGLTLVGFLLLLDPPKKEVKQTLKTFQNLGVDLKILSGDDPLITARVCREVGLEISKNKVILGSELEELDERSLSKTVEKYNVFARLTPEQKFKIVTTLNKNGHIVGFLGDGINDAPALRAADVGISVNTAVDVAQEAADVILLRKSLAVISKAIKEGRKTFGNIIKYIFNTLSANFGNMITVAASSLFLPFIPLLPSQILLMNFISDFPLLTVSTDNVDKDFLKKPKRWNIKLFSKFMLFFGVLSSVFDFIIIGLFIFLWNVPVGLFRTAWFLESVLSEIVITLAIRTKKTFFKSRPSNALLISSILTIILSCYIIYSPIDFLFEFTSMSLWFLSVVLLIVCVYFISAEILKKVFFKKYKI